MNRTTREVREMIRDGFFVSPRDARDVRLGLMARGVVTGLRRSVRDSLHYLETATGELRAVEDGGPKRYVVNKS